MARIFISYSSKDIEFANRLASDLKELWHKPWLDEWEINIGEGITSRIKHGISEADYMIVILSPHSVKSDWVRKELKAMHRKEIKQEKSMILPVLIDDCKIPSFLKDKKYVDFRKNCSVGLVRLINAINPGMTQAPFKDRNAYEQTLIKRIAPAYNMWFCGISLINVILTCKEFFQERLSKQGACIRFLVINPECDALESAADCTKDELENIKSHIELTIKHVGDIINKGVTKGSIELRLMNVAPGFSIVPTDTKESNNTDSGKFDGRISVEFICYRSNTEKRPHIDLIEKRDSYWYKYFYDQYVDLWEASKPCLSSKP